MGCEQLEDDQGMYLPSAETLIIDSSSGKLAFDAMMRCAGDVKEVKAAKRQSDAMFPYRNVSFSHRAVWRSDDTSTIKRGEHSDMEGEPYRPGLPRSPSLLWARAEVETLELQQHLQAAYLS